MEVNYYMILIWSLIETDNRSYRYIRKPPQAEVIDGSKVPIMPYVESIIEHISSFQHLQLWLSYLNFGQHTIPILLYATYKTIKLSAFNQLILFLPISVENCLEYIKVNETRKLLQKWGLALTQNHQETTLYSTQSQLDPYPSLHLCFPYFSNMTLVVRVTILGPTPLQYQCYNFLVQLTTRLQSMMSLLHFLFRE